MRIAIVDLGTVSVRFEIYEIDPEVTKTTQQINRTQRIHSQRQMLRLGDGLYQTKQLNEKSKQITLETFCHYHKILKEFACKQVCAAATSALREAEDAVDFIEHLSQVFGHQIEIIEADTEAAVIARGILANEHNLGTDLALVDIGGGSTEISVSRNNTILDSISLPLGAIRCHQMYLKDNPPVPNNPEEGLETLRHHTRVSLKKLPASIGNNRVDKIVGSSGTIRTLCRVICGGESPANILSRETLSGFIDQITPLALTQIRGLPRMEDNRADIILAGAVLLEELVKFFNAQQVQPTLFSLRHGLLQQEIERALN